MQIQLYAKNFDLTDSIRTHVNEKLDFLDQLGIDIISCRVDVSRDSRHKKGDVFRCEINITVPNKLLRIVEKQFDLHVAIDAASEKIHRQAKKYVSKKRTKERKFSRLLKRFRGRNETPE